MRSLGVQRYSLAQCSTVVATNTSALENIGQLPLLFFGLASQNSAFPSCEPRPGTVATILAARLLAETQFGGQRQLYITGRGRYSPLVLLNLSSNTFLPVENGVHVFRRKELGYRDCVSKHSKETAALFRIVTQRFQQLLHFRRRRFQCRQLSCQVEIRQLGGVARLLVSSQG